MPWQIMGWLGNIGLVCGLWLVGSKTRSCFICTFIGECIWTVYAIHNRQLDLAVICCLFALLAIRNFFKWGKNSGQ